MLDVSHALTSSLPQELSDVTVLPTDTVTFLFTDIEGSTRLWAEHPEAMGRAMVRHEELIRDAVEDLEERLQFRSEPRLCILRGASGRHLPVIERRRDNDWKKEVCCADDDSR